MLRRNGPVMKSVESVLRLEGSTVYRNETLLLTDKAVCGVLAVDARALVEVVDRNTERPLWTRLTDARMVTVVDVARSNRLADQINQPTVYPQLYSVSMRYFLRRYYSGSVRTIRDDGPCSQKALSCNVLPSRPVECRVHPCSLVDGPCSSILCTGVVNTAREHGCPS